MNINILDRFITVEGGEGSGKTSIITSIKDYLEEKGFSVTLTREPGGIETAEKIREVLLNNNFSTESEMLLFGVCRLEHLNQKIKPALSKGDFVICDRYVDSSLIYQGIVGGLGTEKVWEFNKSIVGEYMPYKTFYLDVDAEVGLKRVFTNDREQNLFDKRDIDFHKKVREGYLELIDSEYNEDRIEKINANNTLVEVKKELLEKLERII